MEKPTVQATVVFPIDKEGRIGLAPKLQPIHLHGGSEVIEYSVDMYNGWGGKRDPEDATILDTAIRELFDESSVRVEKEDLELVFRAYFYREKDGVIIPYMDVFFYFLRTWSGTPVETKEMGLPVFFTADSLPYDKMMPADKQLIQEALNGGRGVYEVLLHGKTNPPEIRLLDEVLGK